MSSLFNPGKRGILTLLSVVLIIGIPAIVAYADDSTDTYHSLIDDYTLPDAAYVNNSGTTYTFGLVSADNGNGADISFNDVANDETTALSSLDSVTIITLFNSSATLSEVPAKIVVKTDYVVNNIHVLLRDSSSTLVDFKLLYDEANDEYYYELSSLEQIQYSSAVNFWIALYQNAGEVTSDFALSMEIYSEETVFTDDVVELIVLVGGIVLLIIGTFSLSFIDLDTPGKAFRSAGRAVRSAGRKTSSYIKGRSKR